MNVVPVDYNAMTPEGALRLGFRHTQQALANQGAGPGDAIWASDSEVLVGAILTTDPVYGLVAVPHWETVVHLDDYTPADFERVNEQFVKSVRGSISQANDAGEIFRLVTVLRHIGPAGWTDARDSAGLAFASAYSLNAINELELALLVLREALQEQPDDPEALELLYFNLLRRFDPEAARLEAEQRAETEDVHASTLASCIDIVTMASDRMTDMEFAKTGSKILEWIGRFGHARGLAQVPISALACVQFDLGLVLLRLGRLDEAQAAFRAAYAVDPNEPALNEAQYLKVFGTTAQELAARVRAKTMVVAA